ncbi:MAG TPA: DUF357 domain-containing protein [Candidatus Bilamarchaeaceae archaeon]|nr:DUF357 domain-containing protein [Candidatus Bilamarchaeaceae archaeon]
MEPKVRAEKDIQKLAKIMQEFEKFELDKKYPQILEWVRNYQKDARHFYERGDYFSAFGAANYAFGIMDGILILEEKK